MRKLTFLAAFLGLYSLANAQDVDYTSSIVNSDFEYATAADFANNATVNPTYASGTLAAGHPAGTNKYQWKPLLQTPPTTFYGWTVDFTQLGANNSQGINNDASGLHGGTMVWIGGNPAAAIPENFEFYQILTGLPAGTYKVQCLLGVDQVAKHTSQRIFANNNVQYFGTQADYVADNNLNTSEVYTFAGYAPEVVNSNVTVLKEMKVYTTITNSQDLKLGIRTGGKNSAGATNTTASPMWGWFKTDYFRLTKIDATVAADATLKSLTLSAGSLTFAAATTSYNVTVPTGTTTVTPTALPNADDAIVTGTDPVTLVNGAGTSTIVVKALDGSTTKTYVVNYTEASAGLNQVTSDIAYSVIGNLLSVRDVPSYSVYGVNGVKVAEVNNNSANTTVKLNKGTYFVRTNSNETIKVLVR